MVQRYILSDYAKLIEIWEKAAKDSHHFLSKESFELIKSKLVEYFNSLEVYVYKKAGKDVAFMGVKDDKVDMLFCDPDYQGQGIGTFMLNYAINLLNVRFVDVHEDNSAAIEFYKKNGFHEVARTEHDIFKYHTIHLSYELV